MSEYAVTETKDCGTGSLLAAVAEAGFLIGVERNRYYIFRGILKEENIYRVRDSYCLLGLLHEHSNNCLRFL